MISQKSILKNLYKSTKKFNIYISRNLILKYIKAMIKTDLNEPYFKRTELGTCRQYSLMMRTPRSVYRSGFHYGIFGIVYSDFFNLNHLIQFIK